MNFLKKPYPLINENRSSTLKLSVFVLFFVFGFLYVFQPFGMTERLPGNLTIFDVSLRFAVASAVTYLVFVELMMRFFPKWLNEKNWTLGKELVFINLILLAVSLVNALVGDYCEFDEVYENPTIWTVLWEGIKHSYLVGIFPVALVTIINNIVLIKRNYGRSEIHNEALINIQKQKDVEPVSAEVTIESQSTANSITVDLEDLLFIMADGNYVEFHLRSNGSVKREIQRNTLTNIEEQLNDFDFLFRSHRAYLVNLKKIKESSGNAQGYQLKFEASEHEVPVSRKKLGDFDQLIANLA